jgi:phosphatidylinositol alpha-1,6-mannosyltransferase
VVLNNNKGKLINTKLPFLRWLPAIRELNSLIKHRDIEYILVGHILPLGTVTFIIQKFYRLKGKPIKYSVFFHGMDLSLAYRFWFKRFQTKLIIKSSENLICANRHTADLLKDNLPAKYWHKVHIVNPGVDNIVVMIEDSTIKSLKDKYKLAGKRIMLTVGRLVKRKGVDMVLQALAKENNLFSNLVYVIAGIGPDENYIKNIIKEKNLSNVILLGQISERDKWLWYDICDFFIMPARNIDGDFEGFGIVYLEANMLAKPVIAGSSGGVSDAVINGYNGIIVDPESLDQISSAIQQLTDNKTLCRKMGEYGQKRVRTEFNWEMQIEKIYKIINSN